MPESWRDALRDIALIVVSILLAFGLQAWWEGRQGADRAHAVRSALAAEFEQNLALLRNGDADPRAAHSATLGLLAEFSPGPPEINSDSIRVLVVGSFAINAGFRPAVGVSSTLGADEASEFLGDSLGILLADWQRTNESIGAQGALLESGVVNIVSTWATMGLPVSDFTPPGAGVPRSAFADDFARMLGEPELEALFASRAVELWQMVELHESAIGVAMSVMELLRRGGSEDGP